MKDLLTDLLEYMESRADADIEGPNKEMGFQIRIEEALAKMEPKPTALQPKGKTKEEVWEEVESYHQIEGMAGNGRLRKAIYDAMEYYASQQQEAEKEEKE